MPGDITLEGYRKTFDAQSDSSQQGEDMGSIFIRQVGILNALQNCCNLTTPDSDPAQTVGYCATAMCEMYGPCKEEERNPVSPVTGLVSWQVSCTEKHAVFSMLCLNHI